MSISSPEYNHGSGELSMFCLEGRMTREIYWVGFGFQIWCQLLTHLSRSGKDSLVIVDEPEVYLHPDVQRQLLGIIRDTGADVLMGTHSSEIIAEADPSEIVMIDKRRRTGERLKNVAGIQRALESVGSSQNITLTALAKNRRVLFVEGLNDFRLLRRFARKLGLQELSSGSGIIPLESGGFGSWQRITVLASGIAEALGAPLMIGAVYDRDYFCNEEIALVLKSLDTGLRVSCVLERKEIENYLPIIRLTPQTLNAVMASPNEAVMTIFSDPRFHDEAAAREWFETTRWPNGPVCPRCRSEKHYATKKPGVYRCAAPACRKDFTVTVNTVMERSHVKMTQWAIAFHLCASSKKGFSAHQLHRTLKCKYETAWFIHHRVMEAMREGGLDLPPMGGEGKIVEVDETYYGPKKVKATKRTDGRAYTKSGSIANKRSIVTLVERGGKVRSFHVPRADQATVQKIVRDNISHESRLHTDESNLYYGTQQFFASHETVKHSAKEYARGDVHVNSAEGFFGVFKRGMRGVYQHCSEKHLHRYLAEFDFRYNHREALGFNDEARTIAAVRAAEGKRLTYHQPR
jgi:transposase-like protein